MQHHPDKVSGEEEKLADSARFRMNAAVVAAREARAGRRPAEDDRSRA